jgi:glycosyltransferase involved in cell wall biosynthesis
MRILILEPYANIQGPLPKIIPLLTAALRQAGCEVVAEHWGRHREGETLWEQLLGRISDIHHIRATWSREPFDILLIQSAHNWKTLIRDILLVYATRARSRRVVLQIHGSLLEPIEGIEHKCFKWATRFVFRRCDAVFVSSHIEAEAFSRFAPECRFYVVKNVYLPNALEAPEQVPPEWRLPEGRPVVFFAGRFIREKGILDLLTALPLVLQQENCHLLLAGVGPLELEVQSYLSRLPWAEHVSWVKYLDRQQLELAYSRTTIFVLPTYHIEGFPAVIQDALGHGLPIVTTPIRGVADHLVDGVHALMVEPRQPEQLAHALTALLRDEKLRHQMAIANREKIRDFSPDVVGAEYMQILNSLLT